MIIKFLILCIIQYASSQMFYKKLSTEEQAELFPTVTDSEFLEYEIVPIYHSKIQKRDIRGKNIKFKAFNQTIDLWLNPLDGILATNDTPVFTAKSWVNIMNDEQRIMENIINTLYEDEQQEATIALTEDPNGNIELNGVIGAHNAYVRRLPDKFLHAKERKRSLNDITPPNAETFIYHIIHKIPEQFEYLKTFNYSSQNLSRSKRNILKPIYPEILVILDYKLFKKMNENYIDAIIYILAFFNGVDLKYRSITNPKVRLNIAGILIAIEQHALEYMNHHSPSHPYDLIVSEALDSKVSWLRRQEAVTDLKKINIDVAITLTSQVFCSYHDYYYLCERNLVGMAFFGGACTNHYRKGFMKDQHSAIIHDTYSFEGISTTAHELGHLLGMTHDESAKNFNCNETAGYVMTPSMELTDKGSEWSLCSLEELRQFLSSDQSACLTNKPKNGQKIPRILPGKLENATEQCQRMYGTEAVAIDEFICTNLQCVDPKNSKKVLAVIAAADGTPCGTEKICLHHQCVKESMIFVDIVGTTENELKNSTNNHDNND